MGRLPSRSGMRHALFRPWLFAALLCQARPAIAELESDPNTPAEQPPESSATGSASNESECTAGAEQCGREAFEAGVAAYRAEDYDAARQRFEEALEYRWHPAIALNLGLAEMQTGRFLEAIEVFDRILESSETSPDAEAPPSARASDDAKASPEVLSQARYERQRAREQLGIIEVVASSDQSVEVLVDGRAVSRDAAGLTEVNPGTRKVEVLTDGKTAVVREVTLAPGERLRLNVAPTRELVVSVPPKPEPPPPEPPAPDQPPPKEPVKLDPLWFYASAGVTLALAGVTVWSGVDTRRAFDDFERDLPNLDQREVNRRVEDGHGKETRTNVLIGASAVAAAGTAVIGVFFTDWSGRVWSVSLHPGAGSLRVDGRF